MLKHSIVIQNFREPSCTIGRDLGSNKKRLRYISEMSVYK